MRTTSNVALDCEKMGGGRFISEQNCSSQSFVFVGGGRGLAVDILCDNFRRTVQTVAADSSAVRLPYLACFIIALLGRRRVSLK
mmetsp:Transcript_27969/g.67396  ORF Transcript_27969/g.67396 Transcript_27969/m.67396 type:complete len:84 (-) Transcript_27969:136-387(-)